MTGMLWILVGTTFAGSWVRADGTCGERPAAALAACRPLATLTGDSGATRVDWEVERSCMWVSGWVEVDRTEARVRSAACDASQPVRPAQVPPGASATLQCQLSAVATRPDGLPAVDRGALRSCLAR